MSAFVVLRVAMLCGRPPVARGGLGKTNECREYVSVVYNVWNRQGHYSRRDNNLVSPRYVTHHLSRWSRFLTFLAFLPYILIRAGLNICCNTSNRHVCGKISLPPVFASKIAR